MIDLHPQILEKNGRKEFVVLPYEEFSLVQGMLEDFDDLRALRQAKERESDAPTQSLEDVKMALGV